jgi:integrase
MRIYQREGSPYWYIELRRGKSKSLKTTDREEAEALLRQIEKKAVEGKLQLLDEAKRITLAKFRDEYIEGRSHLSKDTVRADKLALSQLADAVGEKCALRLIDYEKVLYFVKVCMQRNVRPVSINTYLRHIKAALNHARDLGYIKKVPKIKPLKVRKRQHRILSKEEIDNLLAYTKKTDFDMWRIIQFALWTGARRQEVLGARYENFNNTSINIIGKGDKERTVPVLPGAAEAIGSKKDIGPIFKQFHKDTVSHRFKKYTESCRIYGAKFHSLRHTSATHMIKSGIKLEMVQKILGHSDIRTTQIYAEIFDEIIAKEMQKLKF